MDFDPMVPIWQQIATQLKQQIASGRLSPGTKLPGGRDLALTYGINPNTAARVYQELEREGICQTRRGLGTFVTEHEERIRALRDELSRRAVKRFLDELHGLGHGPEDAIALLQMERLKKEEQPT